MSSNFRTAHRNQSKQNQIQKDNRYHEKDRDAYSYTPYRESEPSVSSQNLEIISSPAAYDGSELSVEEIRREFSPPGAEPHHSRVKDWCSAQYFPRPISTIDPLIYGNYANDKYYRSVHQKSCDSHERKNKNILRSPKSERGSLSQNEVFLAAVGGAALAIGGKELWDRRKPKKNPAKSNPVHTAAIGAAGAFAGYQGAEFYSNSNFIKERNQNRPHALRENQKDERRIYNSKSKDSVKFRRYRSSHKSSTHNLADLSSTERGRHDLKQAINRCSHDRFDGRGDSKSSDSAAQLQQIAKAALLAGATEAFRLRNEPGDWSGSKGKRVLTAAIGAGTIDAAADGSGKRHILEAIIGGLASNRLLNGSRNQDNNRSVSSRSRSRSRSSSTNRNKTGSFATLLSAGIGALASMKILEQPRSRFKTGSSRRRQRSSSIRSSSISSRSQSSGNPKHQRNKSIIDIARKSLSTLGLGEINDYERHRNISQSRRSYRSESDSDSSWTHSRHYNGPKSDDRRYRRSLHKDFRDKTLSSKRIENSRKHKNHSRKLSRNKDFYDSDLYYSSRSSTDDEKYKRHVRGRH